MKFQVVNEQTAAAQSANLWPNGVYDFEVREATEKTSEAGNDMIELEVWIFDTSGGRRLVFDYLVSTEKSSWKIRHFAASCGLLDRYETGNLMDSEMVGRTGQCEVSTQAAQGSYSAKNVIKNYLPRKAASSSPPSAAPVGNRVKQPAGDIDDEIPF